MALTAADFDFVLPEELVAARPVPERGADRLLTLGRADGAVGHHAFSDLPSFVRPGDLWVINDARVRKCRLEARRASGGRVELLLLSPLDPGRWTCLAQANRPLATGTALSLADGTPVRLVDRDAAADPATWTAAFPPEFGEADIERLGSVPLPPYILKRRRAAGDADYESADDERYQTVYAAATAASAAAAPTAGLHFTPALLAALEARGARLARVTLDVGLGTFAPVKDGDLAAHRMHEEAYEVPAATAEAWAATRRAGGRVVAVGTTAVRTLESAYDPATGTVRAGAGRTAIFLTPGCVFHAVDALLTNFHTPRSTLLMLVSAFAGREAVLAAYAEAVRQRYRFYSYGDAMFIA